jgi:hypothetical protein
VNSLKIFVGYDPREAISYHVFCQSLISNSKCAISFNPLVKDSIDDYVENHDDRSNDFIYTRFLVPHLTNFTGWAFYFDGDMICQADIQELLPYCNNDLAVCVVKHEYKTKFPKKYLGNINEDYPRKNWSSVIMWNCGHPANRVLTPSFVMESSGSYLHRFSWLEDSMIGSLPTEWNWLVAEMPDNYNAKLLHYTIGTPCFKDYSNLGMSESWNKFFRLSQSGLDL